MATISEVLQSGSLAYTKPTPASVAARRKLAEQLMETTQIKNAGPLGALANTIGSAGSAYSNSQATQEQQRGMEEYNALLARALSNPEMSDADLASLASNPWAGEANNPIAAALMGQAIQRRDPAYDLDLAYKQAQIDKMAAEAELGVSGTDPASVREWQYFSQLSPEEQSQYLIMKRSVPYLDVGTGYVQPNPVSPGAPGGPEISKDNYTPAYDAAMGGASGRSIAEVQESLTSLDSKLPGLRTVVDELGKLAQTATYTAGGQLIDTIIRETGQEPSEAAVARARYIAMVDNQILPLLRDTFGAQFTLKEGENLKATLGNPNLAPAEKQAVLESFLQQKLRDVEALRARVGGSEAGASPPQQQAPTGNMPSQTYTGDPALWEFMTPEERALWQ